MTIDNLTKLRQLRDSHKWQMSRREISDNFYYTNGRYADDIKRLAELEADILEAELASA